MAVPSTDEWRSIAEGFEQRWNFSAEGAVQWQPTDYICLLYPVLFMSFMFNS